MKCFTRTPPHRSNGFGRLGRTTIQPLSTPVEHRIAPVDAVGHRDEITDESLGLHVSSALSLKLPAVPRAPNSF